MKTALFKAYLFFIIIHFSETAKAQKIEESNQFTISLTLNSLSLLDLNFPTLQSGMEIRYKSIAVNYKFGPAINILDKEENSRSTQGDIISYEGNKHKIDVRYYNKQKNIKEINSFIGMEMFIGAFGKERKEGKFYNEERDNEFRYDYVRQEIEVWGLSVKIGFVHYLNKRLCLEYTNSLGMRARKLIHKDGRNIQMRELNFRDKEWKFGYADAEGTKKTPHASMELTINYRLFDVK